LNLTLGAKKEAQINKGEESMKTTRLVFWLGCIFFIMSCMLFPLNSSGDAKRTLGEEVKTYPVSLNGSATVTKPYNAASCVRQGTAHFVAGEDQTCALVVSFPMTITNIKGQCEDNGDTEAWVLRGAFVKGYQVCRFDSCNDNADYEAAGLIKFYPAETDPATVRCSLVKNNKLQVTIELTALKP
jgi:hypothetical protein